MYPRVMKTYPHKSSYRNVYLDWTISNKKKRSTNIITWLNFERVVIISQCIYILKHPVHLKYTQFYLSEIPQ